MDETNPPTQPRKRGGQKGNTNAIKHGFYSRSFTCSQYIIPLGNTVPAGHPRSAAAVCCSRCWAVL